MKSMRFESLEDAPNDEFGLRCSIVPTGRASPRTGNEEKRITVSADFVPAPLIYDSGEAFSWRIFADDNKLRGELQVPGRSQRIMGWQIVHTIDRILPTSHCDHKPDTPAGELAQQFVLAERFDSSIDLNKHGMPLRRVLISTKRAYIQQLYELALISLKIHVAVVIHQEGCIRCALQLCPDVDANVVIS
jgi:hypothetical protein